MPPGMPEGAMCVQRFDDSLNSAIRITYRISLRSSSMPEPRDPLLKVLTIPKSRSDDTEIASWEGPAGGATRRSSGFRRSSRDGELVGIPHHGDPQHSVMILPQVHLRNVRYPEAIQNTRLCLKRRGPPALRQSPYSPTVT